MTARRSLILLGVPFLAVPLLVLLAACGSKEQEPASTAKIAERDTPARLSLEQLRNASYPLLGVDAGARAELVNGEYVNEAERHHDAPGNTPPAVFRGHIEAQISTFEVST